jgi:transposase
VAEIGGTPYIAFRENATEGRKKGGDTWRQMFHFFSLHRDEFLAHYHKRSNVESTFWMIKAKFGEKIRSKTDTAQINEALCKVLCHNICCLISAIYELGIDPVFWPQADA